MKRVGHTLALLSMAVGAFAQGVQKAQPPPQFTSYQIPTVRAPWPRAEIWAYVDVAVLALVLGLGIWGVLTKRSRTELRVLSVFTLLYFGFYRLGCVCSVGAIQNVTYALSHNDYALPWVVAAFFGIPLVVAMYVGRAFCGSACPLGAVQDLVLVKPVKVPPAISGALGTVPYLYLGAAVLFAGTGTAFVICEYDPFVGFFRMSGHLWPLVFGGVLLLTSVFVGRPYCRFLCPYSVLLRWCSVLAKHRVKVSPAECINCHMCASACPFDAIQPPTPEQSVDPAVLRGKAVRTVGLTLLLCGLLGAMGWFSAPTVAQWDKRVMRAHELHQQELNPKLPKTLTTEAWTRHAKSNEEGYVVGKEIEDRFRLGMPLLGVWFGLVIGLRTLALMRRRKRSDYEADGAACVHCARCYTACPVPHRGTPLRVIETTGGVQ